MKAKNTFFGMFIPMLASIAFTGFSSFSRSHGHSYGQATVVNAKDTIPDEDRIFEKVEVEASFAGGDNAWRKFLENNLDADTPVKHKAPAGRYTVVIIFVVDKEGKVSNIEALTNHGYGMEAEVIRILKKAPRWAPAVQDGRNVKAFRKQPVTFEVIEDKKKKKKNKDD